jgi:hypothetical protein
VLNLPLLTPEIGDVHHSGSYNWVGGAEPSDPHTTEKRCGILRFLYHRLAVLNPPILTSEIGDVELSDSYTRR